MEDGKACLARAQALGLEARDKPHHTSLPRASVLVLLTEQSGVVYTLITKRSMKLRSHPGECCFPGGRQDEEDGGDDIRTALREAQEEVGLEPSDVKPVGRLTTTESVNHLCVTPILAWMESSSEDIMKTYPWKINRDEVDSAFVVPLSRFLEEPVSIFDVEWSGEIFSLRTYVHSDENGETYSITGLTAHIAHEAAKVSYGPAYNDNSTRVPRGDANTEARKQGTLSGYLWKREVSSRGRSYWTRRFFVVSGRKLLHHYDNEQQAERKSHSANKKHRLPLDDCRVQTTETASGSVKFEFVVDALLGRVEWHLASESHEDRELWVSTLLQASSLLDMKRAL
jgi:8-oxo-dGTP pyrophosphatase MutT (NUDIX family)